MMHNVNMSKKLTCSILINVSRKKEINKNR